MILENPFHHRFTLCVVRASKLFTALYLYLWQLLCLSHFVFSNLISVYYSLYSCPNSSELVLNTKISGHVRNFLESSNVGSIRLFFRLSCYRRVSLIHLKKSWLVLSGSNVFEACLIFCQFFAYHTFIFGVHMKAELISLYLILVSSLLAK